LSCACSTCTALSREREQMSDATYKPSESILMLVPSRYFVSPRMKMEERARIKKFYKYLARGKEPAYWILMADWNGICYALRSFGNSTTHRSCY
jgi:hypothetical protein